MMIELSSEAERIVEEHLAKGDFGSPLEVVEAALHSFFCESEEDIERLRAEVAVGIAQADAGLVKPWDYEGVRARLLAKVQGNEHASMCGGD